MASISAIHNTLAINLRAHTHLFLASLPSTSTSQHQNEVEVALAKGNQEFIGLLAEWLAVQELTVLVARAFQPLLVEICGRWLDDGRIGDVSEGSEGTRTVDRIVAICALVEVYNELFPILHEYLLINFPHGPISLPRNARSSLHALLIAYYRILQTNRELPSHLAWPTEPLSTLIYDAQHDNTTRLLALRCLALQNGMSEGEREELQTQLFPWDVDCPLLWEGKEVDGWLMPVFEAQRLYELRKWDATEFDHDHEEIPLSPRITNVSGILLLRPNSMPSPPSALVPTATTSTVLRSLALNIRHRQPTLLTSPPSSGKSLLLTHLSLLLHTTLIPIHLSDTSLDARSLLGSYMSSPTQPGTFEWRDGALVRAMRQGKWIVLEDIDRATSEVLGVLKPLVESLGTSKWIGQRASVVVPGRERVLAADGFALFATRSGSGPATFFGAHKFAEVMLPAPSIAELETIVAVRFPRLAGGVARAVVSMWDAVRLLGSVTSTRDVGVRELEKFCERVTRLIPANTDLLSGLNPTLREDIFLEARDVFFGSGAPNASAKVHLDAIASVIAHHLGLDAERAAWVLTGRTPEFEVQKDVDGRVIGVVAGRVQLHAKLNGKPIATRPFAMHRPAISLLTRIATSVSLSEPLLLTGETGTGKTSVITHLAALLRRPLISLNLSHQTEAADLIGGFKPIDARIPGAVLQERWAELFGGTFSRRRNEMFEGEVRRAVTEGRWKRAVGLWRESARMARERIRAQVSEDPDKPRKRRKVDNASWAAFENDVGEFEVQHVLAKGKFAFGFVEGPLVKALGAGDWVLLDEINLASAETLECIATLIQSPTSSITLTEQGALEPVPRHPDFRLFACMNPATDVGKKDLPPNIRARFTELDVPSPDADRETLLSIVEQYIGDKAVADKAAVMHVAEFYAAVKSLAETRQIADGANHRPHYSMRTLARALGFAAEIASRYGLRRALWEGCLMAFTMVLDAESASQVVTGLAVKYLLAGVRNPRSLLAMEPQSPAPAEQFVKFGPFYLERGPFEIDLAEDYITTPSVEKKLIDLARIILTRRFPVLIEGPTSAGKTSSIEFLARRTGHRFVRINNHEHTDIQEYLGSYVSDPATGKLQFQDGLLVRALRNGDWIVLDELNLAPTDVLEALNRLLDDNRELVVPETGEVVKPHPHFMLFATQNPPGLYAGRKVLSRAFRNRFLEVHFSDVPQGELETILTARSRIAPSYARKIVAVFRELQARRQAGRVFETKAGFATLRDLFRWAGRDAIGYDQLAENGYMLLAERARREDDRRVVREVIESVMGVKIDEERMYAHRDAEYLGVGVPDDLGGVIWTRAMQRLFVLVSRALRFNEPVLLVGETGAGKTSVAQIFAQACGRQLVGVNCHQGTETADLIGGQRPVRNRAGREAEAIKIGVEALAAIGVVLPADSDLDTVLAKLPATSDARRACMGARAIFEWYDGPLVNAMKTGDVFLLDEISLADDSVLERLNSVLETGRTIVLAERGGDAGDGDGLSVTADPAFKLIATMNPGGDYGKKELSPALRNRFTEIWVPAVDQRVDLEMIVDRGWKADELRAWTAPLLDWGEWFGQKVGGQGVVSLRDILGWVTFSNSVYGQMSCVEIFHHAAHMTFLDGLGSFPQLSSYSRGALQQLRADAETHLHMIAPLSSSIASQRSHTDLSSVWLGSFAVPRGPVEIVAASFNLSAPTALSNAQRVVRACQLPKPILLEGSPGVGKTSLITALATLTGHKLCRINLSDQTDLIDLFGSDLPVDGGFAWKDGEFLRALKEGWWVLLDEMNLAPQAVLEGLNAVLDHRGSVYIPELGRTFEKHPSFRIFGAQNPLSQGGGRKGLPKSFVNRFTKVYVEELSAADLLLVCQGLFPALGGSVLEKMIRFNTALNEEVSVKRSFGRAGSPWEFNLRDVLRWATLVSASIQGRPQDLLRNVYLDRFRDVEDRRKAAALFESVFLEEATTAAPKWAVTPTYVQIGNFQTSRHAGSTALSRPPRILPSHLPALESLGLCVSQNWLAILTGPKNAGKSSVVRLLADLCGAPLQTVALHSATDTGDLLGSFEQLSGDGFAWIAGPLVEAMERGTWLLLDDANQCPPSVLDRLNSLCEPGGVLTLSERGFVDGAVPVIRPHPGFRLFMALDPANGELSRAMRNRGVEVALGPLLLAHATGREIDHDSAGSAVLDLTGVRSPISVPAQQHLVAHAVAAVYARYFQRLMQTIPELRVAGRMREARWTAYASRWGVPVEFVAAQPTVFYLTSLDESTLVFLRAIDLDIASALFVQTSAQPNYQISLKSTSKTEFSVVMRAIEAVISAVLGLFADGADLAAVSKTQIERILSVLRFVSSLQSQSRSHTVQNKYFDYSAVQVVSGWLVDVLSENGEEDDGLLLVRTHAHALRSAVALSTGLGISQIWSRFQAIRKQAFDLLCLADLRATSEEQDEFGRLVADLALRCKAVAVPLDTTSMEVSENEQRDEEKRHATTIIAQLGILASITMREISSTASACGSPILRELIVLQTLAGRIERLIGVELARGIENWAGRMKRLVGYRHTLWTAQAQQDMLPVILKMQLNWLEDVWLAGDSEMDLHGPDMLFRPTQLRATLAACDLRQGTLDTYATFQQALSTQIGLALIQAEASGDPPRTDQLGRVLVQSISLLTACFGFHLEGTVVNTLEQQCSSLPLAFKSYLLPAVQNLHSSSSPDHRTLGLTFIALSRTLLDLFVPSTPIDPAAIERFGDQFRAEQRAVLVEQRQSMAEFGSRLYGTTDGNAVVEDLDAQIGKLSDLAVSESGRAPGRDDVSRLHMFWSEVAQFQAHVIAPSKITGLLESDVNLAHRAQTLQRSIAGFTQRLESAYPEFVDLWLPVKLGVAYLRLGVALCCVSHTAKIPALEPLVTFPALDSAARVLAANQGGIDGILMRLAALAETSGSDDRFEQIQMAYHQASALWRIDRARESDAAARAGSLYRGGYEDEGDVEREEREFLEMFPTFSDPLSEDTKETTAIPTATATATSAKPVVGPEEMERLVALHHSLFGDGSASGLFQTMQRATVHRAVNADFANLSDQLDGTSLVMQMTLLDDASSSSSPGEDYNFYKSPNPSEARKSAQVVSSLRTRLATLIGEWPDQMVLQHLHTRCTAVLALPLSSPLAHILSALEQLLLETADWEIYANRENTLKAHQAEFTGLIVEWRRLELGCWRVLLDVQAKEFGAGGVREWWFRLFEAVGQSDGDVETLVPLLDEFIRTSPVGQFEARMELLRTFAVFTAASPSSSTRISRILATTHAHFSLFAPRVAAALAGERAKLEADLRGYVKLASWKDVNVHALKASAQRTHHALYKLVRRFRDVLRGPVAAMLGVKGALGDLSKDEEGGKDDIMEESEANEEAPPTFPVLDTSNQTPGHLRNLAPTFSKFRTLLQTRVAPAISAHSAALADGLAVDIIRTAQHLSSIALPQDKEKRIKASKGLTTRKRKAYADLLRELRRAGFGVVRADVLDRIRSGAWVREQSGVASDERMEKYFSRLLAALPALRASVAGHHPDLVTRDLQRGVTFVESVFAMGMDARTRLADAVSQQSRLSRLVERLAHISTSATNSSDPIVVATGPSVLAHAREVYRVTVRLRATLCEIIEAVRVFESLLRQQSDTTNKSVPAALSQEMQSARRETERIGSEVKKVVEGVEMGGFVLLRDEHAVIQLALAHLASTHESLARWAALDTRLGYIFGPAGRWVHAQIVAVSTLALAADDPNAADNTDGVIELLLVHVQSLLEACPEPEPPKADDETEEKERYIETDYHHTRKVTQLLKLDQTADAVERVFNALTGSQAQTRLARLVPFLHAYLNFVARQISAHASWTKTLFKLDWVLVSVLQTLATDGFCRPPEADEDGDGDGGKGKEMEADGTGLGSGAGRENVSKEIEDESQVEGLQGEDEQQPDDQQQREDGDNDAIEMNDDFGGALEDVPSDGEEDKDGEEDDKAGEEEDGPEEQMGELDASDPGKVDEKLWGDDKGPENSGEDDNVGKELDGESNEQEESEVVAKEGKQESKEKEKEKKQKEDGKQSEQNGAEEPQPDDEQIPEATVGEDEQQDPPADQHGAPMDEHVPDGDMLDIPDNLDLGDEDMGGEQEPGEEEDGDGDGMDVDESGMDNVEQNEADAQDQPMEMDNDAPLNPEDTPDPDEDEDADASKMQDPSSGLTDEPEPEPEPEADSDEQVTAKPDVTAGGDPQQQEDGENPQDDRPDTAAGDKSASGDKGASVSSRVGQDAGDNVEKDDSQGEQSDANAPLPVDSQAPGLSSDGQQDGADESAGAEMRNEAGNPLRSLGDALKEIRRRFDEILESSDPQQQQQMTSEESPEKVEYLRPEDAGDTDMQALGPAGDEQVAKLDDLAMMVDSEQPDQQRFVPMEVDASDDLPATKRAEELEALHQQPEHGDDGDDAMALDAQGRRAPDSNHETTAEVDMPDPTIELLTQHLAGPADSESATQLWQSYESLTHDLAYGLCEQLRLILEPTLATRLKGDFRTGKRLNMKKVVAYIASDYTKDKIWLRRTRPSQREYQVLIALDDSKSMADSRSVHLAFQALALVTKALSRLEVGQVAVARFGERVEMLHDFGDAAGVSGARLMDAFRFDQKATDVLALLGTSLGVLERAREASAKDLWQLEIIISDGMCQDHDKLRTVLRRAEEQRVMIVFVIVDSNSILTMNKAEYKPTADGRMELQLERYLESFPFEYYVVLRDVEALPDVLAGTLRQFFERISEE
ncbi:unnamed protein product [Mycena citricolor]|uniref:Midasin n=1 Tax=Mycena citricolor TaxID=2018698 RepID=A0AAD2H6P4_9AGAR|nr:unnamed protein product [Mycena citricolor]